MVNGGSISQDLSLKYLDLEQNGYIARSVERRNPGGEGEMMEILREFLKIAGYLLVIGSGISLTIIGVIDLVLYKIK